MNCGRFFWKIAVASSFTLASGPAHAADPSHWNLAGSYTTRVSTACTWFVKPSGDDHAGGRSLAEALRTPKRAVALAKPGDVVCFDKGTYPTLAVRKVRATAEAPLVFRTVPGAERETIFTNGSLEYGGAIAVENASHVHFYDLRLVHSQTGISVVSSSNVRIEGLWIEDLGQEGIHVGRKHNYDGSERFTGPPSENVDVVGNTVRDTGKKTARYGEGIYIGTGQFTGDDTHHVFVGYNRIEDVRAEAIEIKTFTHDVVVRGNLILGGSHFFHAAITVAIKPVSYPDGNYLIEDNRVYNYARTETESVCGIGVGHGTTVVRNNLIWNIPGGSGICTFTTFGNPEARDVLLENNTVWNPGGPSISLHDGDGRTGVTDLLGAVTLRGNLIHDGDSALAGSFVGPITRLADAGGGPGSGFQRADGVGADVARILASGL